MNLNTSHPLYANLKMLVGVNESNALVDLVTPSRTFTPHANSVVGTGTYGRHFGVRRNSFTTYGAGLSPSFKPAGANTGTLLLVLNGIAFVEVEEGTGGVTFFIGKPYLTSYDASRSLPMLSCQIGKARAHSADASTGLQAFSGVSTITITGGAPVMLSLCRDATSHAIYINGNTTPEVSGGLLGDNTTGIGEYSYIGGTDTLGPMDFNLVYACWFDRVLTPTEVSDLYATLGANNAFGLIAAPVATTTTLSGPASGTVGVASSNFTVGADAAVTGTVVVTPSDGGDGGTFTPTTVSISAGTPTGTFTYTPASTGAKTISTTNDGALSNPPALTYTSNAANAAPTFSGTIANISGTQGTALTGVDVASLFSDTDALTYSKVGTWPGGVTLTGSTIGGTPTVNGTFAGLSVRATDTASQTVDSNAFTITLAASGDTTAPTLTSPTGTSTGTTTASGTVTTNEANGTLYALATIHTTESAATIKAGANTQAITTTGSKSVSFTGLTAGLTHYAHYIHRDAAGNDSAVVTSAPFTTSASGDSTPPTLTGAITPSAITQSGFTISWPAGADNVAVTGYEYSTNGGTSYTDAGNVLSKAVTGLAASTAYSVTVRAYDASGNKSTPALAATVTTSAATGSGTITTPQPLKNNTATVQPNLTGLVVQVLLGSTGAPVVSKTGQTTNSSGFLAVNDAAITPGTAYFLAFVDPTTGAAGITNKITAV